MLSSVKTKTEIGEEMAGALDRDLEIVYNCKGFKSIKSLSPYAKALGDVPGD